MNVKRDELLAALKLASLAVNNKETAPQSSFFMFTGDSIVGDNELLHTNIQFKSGIVGAVKAEELNAILSKMTAPAVEMLQEDDKLVFKVGRSKTSLNIYELLREKVAYLDPIATEEDARESGWVPAVETNTEINLGLEASAPCCSANLTNRALSGILLTPSGMVACDNFQAIRVDTEMPLISKAKFLKGQLLIPASVVKAMMEIGFDSLWVNEEFKCFASNSKTKNWIMFEAIDHTEIEYPDIQFLFDGDGSELDFPEGFIEAVKKAEVFAKNSLKSEEIYVHITMKAGVMTVFGEGANGSYEEQFDCDFAYDISFVAAPRTLEFLISKEGSSAELIMDEIPRIRFTNDQFTYAITIETVGD